MFAKKNPILFGVFVVAVALLFLTTNAAHAAPINNFSVTVTQPDGTELKLFASGDEFYNWLHDAQGYTVIQAPDTGYYVYADLVNGKVIPTLFVAGQADPASVGLSPYLNISPEQKGKIRQAFLTQTKLAAGEINNAPRNGTINNLVVFIRFSDESEFTNVTSTYADMLNNSTAGANSLRNYYREVSYNALTVDSTLFPAPPGTTVVSYQDSHPRSYFQPYHAVTNLGGYNGGTARRVREHTLLRDAINSVAVFPIGAAIDGDGDGYVDSLTFIVSGDPTGWSSLLWPHQWTLYTYPVTINGKMVGKYSFHLNSWLVTGGTGVLAHEMFHVLGSPDLYHYSYNGIQPVGGWDVMENTEDPPQHMGCFMKFKYGNWISSIPELTSPGTYTLNPQTSSTNNCYKIASPYSTTEYFVVEYRNGAGSTFESSLPGTGLLVYRINTLETGNADGPPDEVYIYRPGGTTSVDGTVNTAHFSSNVGRTAINDGTNPSSFMANGTAGGLNLCNIGASNATISFDICAGSVFSIRGNAGVGGATLSYADGTPKTATADGTGLYSFVAPSGWSGTVTPSKTGYTFTPVSRSYTNVLANQPDQNYTATGPTNLLQDSSFEAYTPNPYWTEASTNFGTPLCSVADCGTGGGTAGPRTGSVWSWFGGMPSDETGSLSQTVIIPCGSANLEFYLWIGYAGAGSNAADVFTAKIDGVTVFSANATQISSYSTYTLVTVDVGAYANGLPHTVTFSSVTTEQEVSFNLDDVALLSEPLLTARTISGNSGVDGVTLSYMNGTLKTATADGSGLYSFMVPSGWSGTVTPSKTGSTFTPVNRSYSNVLANQPDQNYTLAAILQFSSPTYSVNENGGGVTITVTRNGSSTGAVGVIYATSNETATAGSDYADRSGTLSWANGDTSNKTFYIPILDDGSYEGEETINLRLSNPTGGAILGSPSTATLTIFYIPPANAPGTAAFSLITQTAIRANWKANGNRSGTEYYCENTTAGTHSGWITNVYWDSAGLSTGTAYTFRVKARNGDGIETAWTDLGSQSTFVYKNQVKNSDFTDNLGGWQPHVTSGCAGVRTAEIFWNALKNSSVLQLKSIGVGTCSGSSGVSQNINANLAQRLASSLGNPKPIVLQLEVQVVSATTAKVCGDQGHEAPGQVSLSYLSNTGATKQLIFLFYYPETGMTCDQPTPLSNVVWVPVEVPKGSWVAFTSDNLSTYVADIQTILAIDVSGEGWDYEAQFDNIQLLTAQDSNFQFFLPLICR